MTIKTRSLFYFDYVVSIENTDIVFTEGAGELMAILSIGSYTPSNLALAIANAMNAAGTNDYFCEFSRADRTFKISATANFDLLISSGVTTAPAWALIGFSGGDLVGLATYESDSVTGQEFRPQFLLQDFVAFKDNEGVSFATTKKTAQGVVEVVGFGEESFSEFNIVFQTDVIQGDQTPIETDSNGVGNLRSFMRYAIKKGPIEFMEDRNDVDTFESCMLEKTITNKDGVAFKLRELYSKGLIGYFESGLITLRRL